MRLSTDSEVIAQEAARWFVRRDSGTWTDAEQAQLDAWLGQHIAHRIAYIRIESVWTKCDRLRALGAGVEPGVIPPRGSWGSHLFWGLSTEDPSSSPV
jgi:transmembrane sensor